MSSLTDILSEFVRDAFRPKACPTEHAGVYAVQSAGPRAVPIEWRARGGEVAQAQSAGDRRTAFAGRLLAQHGDELRDVSLAGPGFVNLSLTDDFLAAHLNRLTEDERLGVERKPARDRDPRLWRSQRRQADACRPSPRGDHRRRAAAAVPVRGRPRARRRASRRLGPAHGAGHRRGRAPAAESLLFRSGAERAVSERESGDARGPGGDLSGCVGRLQSRSGAAAGGARDHGGACRPAGPATGPCGATSSTSRSTPCGGTSARSACSSTCGRARPMCTT